MGGAGILGVGHYLPLKIVTNDDIADECGVTSNAIFEKLGILERRRAADDESPSDLAYYAAKMALESAETTSDEVGLIICCTFTRDYMFPALSCKLHQMLAAPNAGAYDLVANCTGFTVGLGVAASHMSVFNSNTRTILLVGVALQSRFVNPNDSSTAPYFGDGAGATIVGSVPSGFGVLNSLVWTESSAYEAVRMRAGGANYPPLSIAPDQRAAFYEMNGLEVWKQVVRYLPNVMRRAVEEISMRLEDIDFFVFHQANRNLIEYIMTRLGRSLDHTYLTITNYGNTADASIPITISEAVRAGRIQRGDRVLIAGIGAGFTFGVTILRWY